MAAPPSYASATNQHSSVSAGLSAVDFIPDKHETFMSLISKANAWLASNPTWEVKTCESIEFKYHGGGYVETQKMTYTERGNTRTYYVRGLRLWIVPKIDVNQPTQQINYVSFVPRTTGDLGWFSAKYQPLHEMLAEINQHLTANPLPG